MVCTSADLIRNEAEDAVLSDREKHQARAFA